MRRGVGRGIGKALATPDRVFVHTIPTTHKYVSYIRKVDILVPEVLSTFAKYERRTMENRQGKRGKMWPIFFF